MSHSERSAPDAIWLSYNTVSFKCLAQSVMFVENSMKIKSICDCRMHAISPSSKNMFAMCWRCTVHPIEFIKYSTHSDICQTLLLHTQTHTNANIHTHRTRINGAFEKKQPNICILWHKSAHFQPGTSRHRNNCVETCL